MTQNPLAFHSFAFKDSNEYQWSAVRASLTANIVIRPEQAAPYTTRELTMPPNADEKEIKALVEAAVAVPQRDKAAAFRAQQKKTAKLGPGLKKDSGAGWLVLVVIGLIALSSKKGRRS